MLRVEALFATLHKFDINYHAFNKMTIKNKYLVLLMHDLMDKLNGASIFTKLDLRSDYWQLRIVEGDKHKTCVSRYGAYEFVVFHLG